MSGGGGGSRVTAVGESAAGSTSVCSTGGTNQDGSAGSGSAGAIGSISGIDVAAPVGAGAAHSISATRTHEPAIRPAIAGASSSARVAAAATPIRNSTSRKSRGTARRRRTGAPIELTQAYDGAVRWAGVLAAPARVARGKTRPTEPADVGLQGLDPVGQVADDRRQLVVLLRLGCRARCAPSRS